MEQIVLLDGACEFLQVAQRGLDIEPRDRPPEQRGNVGVRMMLSLISSFSHCRIRTASLPLCGGDEQIVAVYGESARIPVRRDVSQGGLRISGIAACSGVECSSVEDRNRVQRRISGKQKLAIGTLGKRRRLAAGIVLRGGVGREMMNWLAVAYRDRCDEVGVGQRHVKNLFVPAQQQRRRMRPGSDRILRFEQFDPSDNLAGAEVEFVNLRRVPQAAPSAATIASRYYRVGERRRNKIARA